MRLVTPIQPFVHHGVLFRQLQADLSVGVQQRLTPQKAVIRSGRSQDSVRRTEITASGLEAPRQKIRVMLTLSRIATGNDPNFFHAALIQPISLV